MPKGPCNHGAEMLEAQDQPAKATNPLVDFDLNDLHPDTGFEGQPVLLQAKGICVVLEDDFKKVDLEAVMNAIRQLKGVAVVKYIDLNAFHDYSNRTRAKMEIREKIGKLLDIGD